MNIVDLHVHSNKSDGSMKPSELVGLAVKKGLSAFALTDHDTTEGIAEAANAASEYNRRLSNGEIGPLPNGQSPIPLEVIPGIEFSTEYKKKDIHIVGLYINYEASFFKEKIRAFVDARTIRNKKCAKTFRKPALISPMKNCRKHSPAPSLQEGIMRNIFSIMVM